MRRRITVYHHPNSPPELESFFAALDERLCVKLLKQIYRLTQIPVCELKEPHFKHFSIEKYGRLYELRERNKILVRVIFTMTDRDIILLTGFIKRRPRDTMRALETALGMLADLREHPQYVSEFIPQNIWQKNLQKGGRSAAEY